MLNEIIPLHGRKTIILPKDHIAEYEGKAYNWFVGDWNTHLEGWETWGMEKGWNTMNAVFFGLFNKATRELTIIIRLQK